jgi:hypothetical protein
MLEAVLVNKVHYVALFGFGKNRKFDVFVF